MMQTLRENLVIPAVLLVMSTALLVLWQPWLYGIIIWGAALAWLVVAIWRGPRNWAALWKPAYGWRMTGSFIIAGIIEIATASGGLLLMGVFFLIAGVANAIGLLWWPGRLRHQPPL